MEDSEISISEYRNIIREMIKNENEIRNQRTNWFLVIQGFFVAAICQKGIMDCNLCYLIAGIGSITSISFSHAAWRSELAVSFALACWKERFDDNQRMQLPPVSLIVKDILEVKEQPKIENCDWKVKIQQLMYPPKNTNVNCCDRFRNKCDWMLPYRALPILFFLFWIVVLILRIYLDHLS